MREIKLNPISEVLQRITTQFDEITLEAETVELLDAKGRYIYDDILSDIIIPAYRKSTVDGYAIKKTSEPTNKLLVESHDILDISEISVGEHCVYVPTGGRVPDDADVMVKIEETEKNKDSISFNAYPENENIIEVGADLNIGDVVMNRRQKVTTFDIGVLASLGHYSIKVFRKPTLAIISTGDELIKVNEPLTLGATRDINGHTLQALATEFELKVVYTDLINDTRELLKQSIIDAHKVADITVVSGGSSVGIKDYTFGILDELGDVLSDGMALKPGKPTIVCNCEGKPIIGLPGHPVSAIMVFKILMPTLIRKYGIEIKPEGTKNAIITRDVYPARGRDTYQMIHFEMKNGILYAEPTSGKSGMMTLLTHSEGYTVVTKDHHLDAGDWVQCHVF